MTQAFCDERLVLGPDFDAMQLERADDPLREQALITALVVVAVVVAGS
jgi:hypothetical protein